MPSVLWIGDEVKNGSIVPNVELTDFVVLRDVSNNPFDQRSPFSKSSLGRLDGGLRYVEYCDMLESRVEQSIDEERLATADVKHATSRFSNNLEDQIE
jgi:hypothetical protein